MFMIDKMVALAKKAYYRVPVSFRFVFWPARPVAWLMNAVWPEGWLLDGTEILSKEQLTILFAGMPENKNYIAELAFDGRPAERSLGRSWVWRLGAAHGRQVAGNLALIEAPAFVRGWFKNSESFYLPCWVNSTVDLSKGVSFLIDNDSARSDLRRVLNNKLDFEVSRNPDDLRLFYEEMFLPYITKAHGDSAFLIDYHSMRKQLKNWDLVLVKKNEQQIAGMVIRYERSGARLLSLGVRDASSEYVRQGAIAASYYFSFQYLYDKGYRTVNMGNTRPFLKDGVLQYKKKWHPTIHGPVRNGFMMRTIRYGAGVNGFLLNNPFLFVDGRGLSGAIFRQGQLNDENRGVEKLRINGMTRLTTFILSEDGHLDVSGNFAEGPADDSQHET